MKNVFEYKNYSGILSLNVLFGGTSQRNFAKYNGKSIEKKTAWVFVTENIFVTQLIC